MSHGSQILQGEEELLLCEYVFVDMYTKISDMDIVTDLTKPLPGNGSVSMFKRAKIEECHRY
jgi:diphthamide biosynthesis methyltransferase